MEESTQLWLTSEQIGFPILVCKILGKNIRFVIKFWQIWDLACIAHVSDLIWFAFITGNCSLEPLLEGLLAQIHVNLSWRVFGWNRTRDLRITKFVESRALHHWAKVTDESPKILQDPLFCPPKSPSYAHKKWTAERSSFVRSHT